MKRNILLILCIIISIVFPCSCSNTNYTQSPSMIAATSVEAPTETYTWEPAIVGMEALSYPNKLVYVSGVDHKLDLTGGVVRFVMEDGSEKKEKEPYPGDMAQSVKSTEANNYWNECELETNVNFDVPGIYTVKIIRHETAYVEFHIQVVSREWLQDQLDKASGD